jgi:hypothetical protein
VYNPLRHPDDAEPWPIATTLGGPIRPFDHVGHVAEYLDVLAAIGPNQVGAYLPGDRRQGKTSLLSLLEAVLGADDDVRVLRVSAETKSSEVLTGRLRETVRSKSWLGREAERWALDLDVSYKGIRLRRQGGKRAEHDDGGDDLLVLAARRAAPRRLVVIIDEISIFVQALASEAPAHADEFLHTLRRARQESDNLSVILSGSLGLHHVLPTMQPVNDLRPVRIGRLTDDEAVFLARCLLLGAGVHSADPIELAAALAATADGGAFYLHHLIAALEKLRRPATPDDVGDALEQLLRDPDDPLDFKHYLTRLKPYYGPDASLAERLLDEFALSTATELSIDDVGDAVSASTGERPDRDHLVDLVSRLEQDHYLEPTSGGSTYSSSLLRRAWIAVRRLDR